jgi:DNA-binding IclR family transcriptional regulator
MGIQSVEAGMRLLAALAQPGGPHKITQLARVAGLTTSNARRYLVSFIATDMVEQNEANGLYKLGPLALHLGLAAMHGLDYVQVAMDTLRELRAAVDHALYFSMWHAQGPIVIRAMEPRLALTMLARPGTVLPLLSTASGRIFAAYLPNILVKDIIARESAAFAKAGVDPSMTDPDRIQQMLAEVRRCGYSFLDLRDIEGVSTVSAVAVPLLDHMGDLVGVFSANAGAKMMGENRPDNPTVLALLECVGAASRRLGYQLPGIASAAPRPEAEPAEPPPKQRGRARASQANGALGGDVHARQRGR